MSSDNPSESLQNTWRQQCVWSRVANDLKGEIGFWQSAALLLAVVGAIIETLAAQLAADAATAAKLLSIGGAMVLALVPVIRAGKLGKDRLRNWIRARSASEGLKTEIYFYLTRTPPYDKDDRATQLAKRRDGIVDKAKDLQVYVESDEIDEKEKAKWILEPLDVSGYISRRVKQQIETFYRPRATDNARRLQQTRTLGFSLGIAAAVFGALGGVKGLEQFGAWVAVLTTMTGAIIAYAAAARYEYLVISYRATGHRLGLLCEQWQDSQGAGAASTMTAAEFIKQCEEAISIENQGWMADWL